MNSQERDVIAEIFQRLEQAANQPRDADAERFIAERLRAQPYAPYAMAQLVYVQEEAIKSLNQQLEQARAEAQRGAQAGGGSGGFLSSIFGGGQRQDPPQQQRPGGPWGQPQGAPGYAQPQGGPGYGQPPGGGYQGQGYQGQGYAPQQGYPQQQTMAPQGRGSGFLGSALTTAAGVAGGMVVGNALMNAFSGHHSALGSMAGGLGGMGGLGGGETIVENNYFGSDANAGTSDFGSPLGGGSDAGFQDSSLQDSSLQDSSFDDGGSMDDGSNDDWV